jgi:type II secretory ATPase GspE/PulE/Tfp pilus assembly ATPase PilB-like protein
VGCDKCRQTGYKGRLGLHELLVADDEMKRLIQERARVAGSSRHGTRCDRS